jgi:hypothetical protein
MGDSLECEVHIFHCRGRMQGGQRDSGQLVGRFTAVENISQTKERTKYENARVCTCIPTVYL